ncbi:avidin/streptavidin family protein [Streptomyces sp. NRRL B-24484]|uniref:avidin/streptavidin family protein n=1 Tax=Streptomyces sp. NRRL B-24484 TaxID=1463833 RepID=UPI0004C0EB5F|nr:avidin/streptavidin family protein [Streptomyces sp. NRRL B-24484]
MGVTGDWYNEFGSRLRLRADAEGLLTGTFEPGAGPAGRRDLIGRLDVRPGAPGVALGWTVAWRDDRAGAAATTSWNGQYFPDSERIVAGWLFTTATGPDDAWKSTVIGQDTFRREPPTD